MMSKILAICLLITLCYPASVRADDKREEWKERQEEWRERQEELRERYEEEREDWWEHREKMRKDEKKRWEKYWKDREKWQKHSAPPPGWQRRDRSWHEYPPPAYSRPHEYRGYGWRPPWHRHHDDDDDDDAIYTPWGYYEDYPRTPYDARRPRPGGHGRIGPFRFEVWK
jgi:hypothetical protein